MSDEKKKDVPVAEHKKGLSPEELKKQEAINAFYKAAAELNELGYGLAVQHKIDVVKLDNIK